MAAEPTSASTTSLTVLGYQVELVTGSVSVAVGGQTGTSSENFTVTAPAPAPAAPVVSSFSPSEGEVGISVTITGENFSATALENEVKFGGVMAAAPTSASTTSLVVLVPSGARTGRISVAVGGQTGTSSDRLYCDRYYSSFGLLVCLCHQREMYECTQILLQGSFTLRVC